MHSINRVVRLSLPFWLVPAAFFVKWLGCSCPILNAQGELVPRLFNANDLTRLVAGLLAAAALVAAARNLRRLSDGKSRLLYALACLAVVLPAAYLFVTLQYWR